MSKNWYPIIDYDNCNSCGKCTDFCRCIVFEMIGKKINISNEEECIWGCSECGDRCPQKAIINICDFENLISE